MGIEFHCILWPQVSAISTVVPEHLSCAAQLSPTESLELFHLFQLSWSVIESNKTSQCCPRKAAFLLHATQLPHASWLPATVPEPHQPLVPVDEPNPVCIRSSDRVGPRRFACRGSCVMQQPDVVPAPSQQNASPTAPHANALCFHSLWFLLAVFCETLNLGPFPNDWFHTTVFIFFLVRARSLDSFHSAAPF